MTEKRSPRKGIQPFKYIYYIVVDELAMEAIKDDVKAPSTDEVEGLPREAVENPTQDNVSPSLIEVVEKPAPHAQEADKSMYAHWKAFNSKMMLTSETNRKPEQSDSVSKKVQEGQKWNNRARGKPDKSNVKSDLTSQEESSDPVAIRKQVRRALVNVLLLTLLTFARSNSISQIRISTRINFSIAMLTATETFQSLSKVCIPSSACATFSPIALSSLR